SVRTLRTLARGLLPGHLVPSVLVMLDRLPRTGNGKIDRAALRELAPPVRANAGEPPRGDTETMLAQIWEEAFALDGIGRSDDFFELAGDSLIAAVIAARVYASVYVELHFGDFVAHPVLSAMAAFIDHARGPADRADDIPLRPADRSRPLPLSL